MKIAIMASLFAKRNVYVNACHLILFNLILRYKHITIISFCLLLLGNTLLKAQEDTVCVKLLPYSTLPNTIKPINSKFESVDIAKTYVQNLVQKLLDNGYFSASVDSFKTQADTLYAFINVGKPFEQLNLNIADLNAVVKQSIQISLKDSIQINWKDWNVLTEKLLQYGENHGYPFSSVQLQNVAVNDSAIHAKVNYTLGKKYTIDSIEIRGTAKINQNYIENYIDLKKGAIYNEQKIARVNQKLLELPFVKAYRSPAVEFFDSRARLFLFMNDQKVNRFDFLLGLLPNSNTSGGSNLKITGEGLLTLVNTFGYGEKFHIEYKNNPDKTKTLLAQITSGYLPFLPIGANVQFNLNINDTLYINRIFEAGILYPMKGSNFVKAFYEIEQSNLLEIDEQKIIDELSLPENLDWRKQNYGLSFNYEKLDYRFNPTQGVKINCTSSIGAKTILPNLRILQLKNPMGNSFDFSTLYNEHSQKLLNYEFNLQLDKYWKITSTAVLKTSINSSYLYTSKKEKIISESELYRIGGLESIRGFDEQSIVANWFNILTTEFRYLIGTNSYFAVFGDLAYIQNSSVRLTNPTDYDLPIGIGAGLNFETSTGIFSLNYALGKQLNNNFNLKSGKIHFGFLNYF